LANYKVSANTNNSSNKKNTRTNQNGGGGRQIDQLSLFTFKYEFLKISVGIQTLLAAETYLGE
jgi:hypothetical protein